MAPPVEAPKADIAALQARVAQLEKELAAKAPAVVMPGELPAKYRGTKSYVCGQKHYRKGRMYEIGEVVTVTDEIPSRTWAPVDEAVEEKHSQGEASKQPGRASDRAV